MISEDQDRAWSRHDVPDSIGCVHMNVQTLTDGSLLTVYRNRQADHIYASRSQDGRAWGAPQPTMLPNNNSSVQFMALHNGHFALVYNEGDASHSAGRCLSLYNNIEDTEDHGKLRDQQASTRSTAFWDAPRVPLSLTISEDGGHTWHYHNIEIGDGYCMTNNSTDQHDRKYSYPSIVQRSDGALHIAFTYFHQRIKYVTVDESWVRN